MISRTWKPAQAVKATGVMPRARVTFFLAALLALFTLPLARPPAALPTIAQAAPAL